MAEKPQNPSRHPRQDEWDRQRAEAMLGNQSTNQLQASLETSRRVLSGEISNGLDAAYNEIHSRVIREKLGERGIATEIYRPEQ
jgi:hypothetical protein